MRLHFKSLLYFLAMSFIISCNDNRHRSNCYVEPAFYYWKSNFSLSRTEKKRADSLHIRTLYVKFFDVTWDDHTRQPLPAAQLRVKGPASLNRFTIIPTVFITNECIFKMDSSQAPMLAEKIAALIRDICTVNGIDTAREIQIDCDWTAQTKEKYFTILNTLRPLFPGVKFSATIRLHQVKFLNRTGVPPVDRGMLMCYNMGNLANPATRNSIIDVNELKKYIAGLADYPLPLDVAFPIFEWKVWFRNDRFEGLVENFSNGLLGPSFVKQEGNRYTFLKDTLIAGYAFKKKDVLRSEQSSFSTVMDAVHEIGSRLSNDSLRVSLYHLDSITLEKYTAHEMEAIFNGMR
jgi:hypothetical protein